MTTVEIEYCHPCGLLDSAVEIQRSVLETFGEDIDSVALRTGKDGVFKVYLNGEEILDDEETFDPEDVVNRVRRTV